MCSDTATSFIHTSEYNSLTQIPFRQLPRCGRPDHLIQTLSMESRNNLPSTSDFLNTNNLRRGAQPSLIAKKKPEWQVLDNASWGNKWCRRRPPLDCGVMQLYLARTDQGYGVAQLRPPTAPRPQRTPADRLPEKRHQKTVPKTAASRLKKNV